MSSSKWPFWPKRELQLILAIEVLQTSCNNIILLFKEDEEAKKENRDGGDGEEIYIAREKKDALIINIHTLEFNFLTTYIRV